jgi:large subunit ribosomal protein L13
MKKTTLRQNVTNLDRKWFIVDATNKTIGELSTNIANVLRGKHRVDFTPHADNGDYVIVLNAEKVRSTGNKEEWKRYRRHSGYMGNLKSETLKEVRRKNPTRILEDAVAGMLPKNKLRKVQLRRLKLMIGSVNPHSAQQPENLPFL